MFFPRKKKSSLWIIAVVFPSHSLPYPYTPPHLFFKTVVEHVLRTVVAFSLVV